MAEGYRIHLNFLPVSGELPDFMVYRKPQTAAQEVRPPGEVNRYRLPVDPDRPQEWAPYWVSAQRLDGFDPIRLKPSPCFDLTTWMLFTALSQRCRNTLKPEDYWIQERGFYRELHLVMRRHSEGDEQLIVQPYHLRAERVFGVLVDFHFRMREGARFSRRVQQLSLSLDRNFRRNLDCYAERTAKIADFLDERWNVLSPFRLPGVDRDTDLHREFTSLPAYCLRPKVYVFGNGHESRSQFNGLKDAGPLEPLASTPRLLFVFREQDRQAARTLATTLRGDDKRGKFSFPGFKHLFKADIDIDRNPVVIPDFSVESMRIALERTIASSGLPILIMPDNEDEGYLNHKAIFTNAGIPSQVCTVGVIQDQNVLKWSVANIALQIFCKAGGMPWKVRPAAERCLIVGISQSHKVRKDNGRVTIEKYFAFSILTDSSGLFQKIQVLGESESEGTYLEQVRANLRRVLDAGKRDFSYVVVHSSFKLKHREMDAIQDVVEQAAVEPAANKCRFAVVKVNHKSRFFGVNRETNSLVPYEGTRVNLGPGEFLVWFEGIFPDKPTVTKAFPGPTHLQFLRLAAGDKVADDVLLQDLVNLSGANWRGFNAKSAPVSVFYCHLVAEMVHDFQQRGLPLPAVEGLKPWFL